MTTADIETYADIGGLAGPDINLKVLLRHNVVPAFFTDVGYPSWRRVPTTLSTIISTKSLDLPDDFGQMITVSISPDFSKPLQYIGEDPEKLLAAEGATVAAKPTGYYLTRRATSKVFKKIAFNCPCDQVYTIPYVYHMQPFFLDDTTSIDLDQFMPAQFQWSLVEGLKQQILFLRFGIGDPRYVTAEQSYKMWVERAMESPELARRNLAIYAR